MQALTRPGDIVLIDRNCHKSHHYGLVLAGAYPLYLDAYELQPFAIYGAVSLHTIKKALLDLEAPDSWAGCACCCSPTARSTASSTTRGG